MLKPFTYKFRYGHHIVSIETNMIARQSSAAVMVSIDGTSVLVTIVGSKEEKVGQNFFPLMVNYQERTYAAGRFPGGFFRREGRPNENEIIVSRLIDRPIRPLFPNGFLNEIQIVATVVSINPQINPDIVAMIGASTALGLSDIPFNGGPIGVARIGYINGSYVLNPTQNELNSSLLDLVISGTEDTILMVESKSYFLSEKQILNAIMYGYEQQKIIIHHINKLIMEMGNEKWVWKHRLINKELQVKILELSKNKLEDAYKISDKKNRYNMLHLIKKEIKKNILEANMTTEEKDIEIVLENLERNIIRSKILNDACRIDGRRNDMVRELDIRTGILPRTHGSALFTRGETQVLVTVTLGTERDAQNVDELIGERIERFLLHYNFPPYCVGEIGIIGSPKRREIGHGNLTKRAIVSVMPDSIKFPYTVRIVSEVTESNGSSSMASVCGASLALMDAGVPIKSSVAGVAMGLVKEGKKFVILSDIMGDEDKFGDMDFKIAGSKIGITALQMDMKIMGISKNIIEETLMQSKDARLLILNSMEKIISVPRCQISKFAPRIYTIKIRTHKIKDVIGKGGSVIRSLTEETGTIIEIKDDGTVKIAALDGEKAKYAIRRIKEITDEIEVGNIYNGKVMRIVNFGAFISVNNSKEGLVHISQISNKRVKKVTDYLYLGQKVLVKVIEIDKNGKMKLSIKEAISTSK